MSKIHNSGIKICKIGTAMEQMCNYVAISETQSPAESLRRLILHTLYTFDQEKVSSDSEVVSILETMFGVVTNNHQVQEALEQLELQGMVHRPLRTNYVLTTESRAQVGARIKKAELLQENVKGQWLSEIAGCFPELPAESLWSALQEYLAKAFLRHGIQVAIFLDPTIEHPTECTKNMSILLHEAVRTNFEIENQEAAKHAISDFLAGAGKNTERAQFITECADGAANYFSLAVSPDAAMRFRENLCPLKLFCDTNFLFGILDLHVHPLVDVSNNLLDVISKHELPISFHYHEATLRELRSSISYHGEILKRNKWQRALSRAAIESRLISGIELKYHQKNSEMGIDVDIFLRPYEHADVILEQRNISLYKPQDERLIERATIEAEYREYLKKICKEKTEAQISHDVEVLDCVRFLRKNVTNTLEAGVLLVTCDYSLYSFDSDMSREARTCASVVLPNILWQILRPFVPNNQGFDRAFAETFAIPEFRTIGSGSARACSKMLGLLATYQDFPEETAARLLSNDLLMLSLRAIQSDDQFKSRVESEIVSENKLLLESQDDLKKQIEKLKKDNEQFEKDLIEKKQAEIEKITREMEEIRKALFAIEKDALHTRQENSLIKRGLLVSVIFILVGWFFVFVFLKYAQGQNLFQKLCNSWIWLSAGLGLAVFFSRIILGRKFILFLKSWKEKYLGV